MPPNAGRDASIVVADSISESDGVEIEPTDRRRGSSEPMPDAGDAPIETRAPGAEAAEAPEPGAPPSDGGGGIGDEPSAAGVAPVWPSAGCGDEIGSGSWTFLRRARPGWEWRASRVVARHESAFARTLGALSAARATSNRHSV